MANPGRPERLRCSLDLDRVVFDGEVEMRHALMEDPKFADLLLEREPPSLSTRRKLLLSALRLTREMAPEPFAALDQVKRIIEPNLPVELFCVASHDLNAFIVPPESGVVLVGISSEALERFDQGELCFVFGHEIAHALFDHFQLSPEGLAGHDEVAPLNLVRLCAWMRYAELSADRVGLLCCDDFDTAVRAFFKLTSGLSGASYLRHAEMCAEQYAAVAADHIETSEEDWFNTHPYSPLRIKALDLFARSETFHALRGRSPTEARFHRMLGRSGSRLSEAELEAEVQEIMRLMDPTFLRDSEPLAPKMREFLALTGLAVALADGKLARGERQALGSLVGSRGVTKSKKKLMSMSAEEHDALLSELAHELRLQLSPLRRRRLVEDLVHVALADRELHRAELSVIADAAQRLDVDPFFVERALERALDSLD